MCKGQGAVDGNDVRQGRRATAGGTGQPAGVTPGAGSHHNAQRSHGILSGDGDRPELAAPIRRTMNINQLDGTPYVIGCNLKHYNKNNANEACNRLAWLLVVAAITFKF